MQLFVDFVNAAGEYTSADKACVVDPALPLAVLTAPVFLNALGHGDSAPFRRVFHVESGTFVDATTLADCNVDELDTIIVVNSADAENSLANEDSPAAAASEALRQSWWRMGGPTRRCGDMVMRRPNTAQLTGH